MLNDKCLEQILDSISHDPALGLTLFCCGIAPFQLRCKHLLRCNARLMER